MTTILQSRKTWALLILAVVAAAGVFLTTLSGKTTAVAGDETEVPFHLAVIETGNSATEEEVPFLERRDSLIEAGYDLSSARLLATNAAGSQVIAMVQSGDDRDQLCVIATDADHPRAGAGGCGSASDFNKYGMFTTLTKGNPETDEVVGLLPDGVDSIVVHSADGEDRELSVESNVVRFARQGATSATVNGVHSSIAGGLNE